MPGTSAFPGALDTFPDIGPNDQENEAGKFHDEIHNDEAAAIVAIQTVLGITGSVDTSSVAYKLAALALFATNENIQDIVAGFIAVGSGLTIAYDDTLNALTLSAALNPVTPVTVLTSSSGVLTIDLSLGRQFEFTLTENVTSVVITNAPAAGYGSAFSIYIKQHASAAKTMTGWPSGFTGHWFGGEYVVSTALGAVDELGCTYYSSTKITGKYAKAAS